MRVTPAARRLTLWIATLAILLAALAPAFVLLPFTSETSSAPWHQICTASGQVASSADEQSPTPLQTLPGKHCPWCSHNIGLALPPLATPLIVRLMPADRLLVRLPDNPPLRGEPPYHPAAWRGPPVIS
jgi:hypothetical protein